MDITLLDATLVPIIMGLVAAIKSAGLPTRWLPLVAVVLGVIGVWVYHQNRLWISGIVMGLAAVGLYSGTRATVAPAA